MTRVHSAFRFLRTHLTPLALLNFFVLQWTCFRLARYRTSGLRKETHYLWVGPWLPLTGWWSPYRWPGVLKSTIDLKEMELRGLRTQVKNLTHELEQAKAKISKQRHALRWANDANRQRNIELDALRYVWCSGGCPTGVARWSTPVTQEHVDAAVRNTERLVAWWKNYQYRQRRQQQKDES